LFFFFFHSDILSDVCGKLECESSVGKSIRGECFFWCRVEPLPSQPVVNSPVLPLTPAWTRVGDWKQAVRHALSSPDIKIRITDSEIPLVIAPRKKT
jgi:hypothetical protein